jgi:hypothetical protein
MPAYEPGFASISKLQARALGGGLYLLRVDGLVGVALAPAPYTFTVVMTSYDDHGKPVAEGEIGVTLLPPLDLLKPVILLVKYRPTAGDYTLKAQIWGDNDEVLAYIDDVEYTVP